MPLLPDWTSTALSFAALIVSGLSFYVSWRNYRRLANAERVTAWIELKRHGTEWSLATLSVKNPSSVGIKVSKIVIDIPDFRVAGIDEASIEDGYGNITLPSKITLESPVTGLQLPDPGTMVASGETKAIRFLIFQPSHNRKRSTNVRVMYWTMEPKPKWRILPVTVTMRSAY